MKAEATARLRSAFPETIDLMLARTSQEGIWLADDLVANTPFLNNAIGNDLRGHFRRVGLMYQIHERCQRGDLPFDAQMKSMPHGNWHCLEILADGVWAHVCRTDSLFAFPEDTPNRQDSRLRSQLDLLSWEPGIVPFRQSIDEIPRIYAWLGFGAEKNGQLSHLFWGVPDAESDRWLGHEDILKGASISPVVADSAEPPDPKTRLRFREHVEAALEKDADDKKEKE